MTRSRWILDTPVVPNRSTSTHFSFKKNMVAARLRLFDDQPPRSAMAEYVKRRTTAQSCS